MERMSKRTWNRCGKKLEEMETKWRAMARTCVLIAIESRRNKEMKGMKPFRVFRNYKSQAFCQSLKQRLTCGSSVALHALFCASSPLFFGPPRCQLSRQPARQSALLVRNRSGTPSRTPPNNFEESRRQSTKGSTCDNESGSYKVEMLSQLKEVLLRDVLRRPRQPVSSLVQDQIGCLPLPRKVFATFNGTNHRRIPYFIAIHLLLD